MTFCGSSRMVPPGSWVAQHTKPSPRYDHLLLAAQLLEGSFLRRWIHSAFRENPDRFVGRLLNRDDRWICSELAAYCLDCQPEYADKGVLALPHYAIDPQELFEDQEIFAAWHNEPAA